MKSYIVGQGTIPKWCRRVISQYRKPNGNVGYELYTRTKYIQVNIGDEIYTKDNKHIKVRRMKAKEFLSQLQKLNKLIENKEIEKQQWKEIATNTSAQINGERIQSSGNKDKMADAVAKYMDIEKEIEAVINGYIETKKDIIKVLESLESEEYDFLHKIYVQGYSFKEVALSCDRSQNWASGVHSRGLSQVQRILDERKSDKM